MGRGPGIPLEIKQQIARIFDELGNSKKARREARAFHSRARPGAHQLSYRTLTHIYDNRREFLAMQNLPSLDSKRKNLKRKDSGKPTSSHIDDFKLEPIDDDSPDVKMEVFEIENSEEAIETSESAQQMVIEEIGTEDVKIEVLEINTAEDENFESGTNDEKSYKVEQSSSYEKFEVKTSTDLEDNVDFFIADKMNLQVSSSTENSSPQLIELNDRSENNLRCSKCGFEARHTLELARHKTFAHRLSCSHCAYTTNQDSLLAKHILSHKDVKRFKCDLCPYASKRKADLQAHRKRHIEDKSDYQCERCGFVTHLKSALARHKARIHKEIVLSLYS